MYKNKNCLFISLFSIYAATYILASFLIILALVAIFLAISLKFSKKKITAAKVKRRDEGVQTQGEAEGEGGDQPRYEDIPDNRTIAGDLGARR